MTDQEKTNKEFQLQFCTTNLQYMTGGPQTPDVIASIQKMRQEIARLEAQLGR